MGYWDDKSTQEKIEEYDKRYDEWDEPDRNPHYDDDKPTYEECGLTKNEYHRNKKWD